jgi:hypothetical protein
MMEKTMTEIRLVDKRCDARSFFGVAKLNFVYVRKVLFVPVYVAGFATIEPKVYSVKF